MINEVKRFRLCMFKKNAIKEEGTFANFKCNICNDHTIRCINNFHICFLRGW